jgi:Uma2 family endonuclease
MNTAPPEIWTQERFFIWSGHSDARFEFDGHRAVALRSGSVNHSAITVNLLASLRGRLRGSERRPFGPDAGLATTGRAIRYPDALVTCSKVIGTANTVPGVVVVFEVLSPPSGRTDRIVKLREYAAVATIRRYVILESTSIGLTVMERQAAEETWRATSLMTGEDILLMPEIGIEVPIAEFYEGVEFGDALSETVSAS